jgi:hypothetical protein
MTRAVAGALLLAALALLPSATVSAADFPCRQLPLLTVPARAAQPRLVSGVAARWQAARVQINAALGYAPGSSGSDWLAAQPSDMLRDIAFRPTQSNQILYSWHKTGRAVDIPQTGPGLTHVVDPVAPGYELFSLRSASGQQINITAIMQANGFARIPSSSSRPEWWHFEVRDGLSWQGAMSQIYTTAQLQAVYPELSWSNVACTGPDPVEPAGGEDGGVPRWAAIPDLVAYVTFTLPDPDTWWPAEPEPPGPGAIDFIGQALYPFQWLGWLVRMAVRQAVVIGITLAQYGATFLAAGINAVLGIVNTLARLLILMWLHWRSAIYAGWGMFASIRERLYALVCSTAAIQPWLAFLLDLLALALDIIGQALRFIQATFAALLGLLGWMTGLSLGLLISITAQLEVTTVPPQLTETDLIYRMVRGFSEGIRDSAIGWLLYLIWGMCYVAFLLWLSRFLSSARGAS